MRPMFALALSSLSAGLACLPAMAVGLDQLYDEALNTDAQLQGARASLTADSEQLPQARAKLLPQLSASLSANEQRTEFGGGFPASNGNSNGFVVSLTQPLINVASWQGYQQGQIALTSAQAQFAAARQDLIVRLGQAYFDALSAQDSLAIVRSQKASIAQQLESAKHSFDAGSATITDTNEAQAKYDQAVSQEIAAQNDLDVKLAALEQIVGHPVTRVDGLARGVTLPPPVPADMQQWVDAARDANYDVVLKQLAVSNAQRETLKAKAGHYPSLDLVASYSKSSLGAAGAGNFGGNFGGGFGSGAGTIGPGIPAAAAELGNFGAYYSNATVGVQLTIPLYEGGATQSRVRQTLALEDKSQADLDQARRSAALSARQAFLGVSSGLAQVRALETAERSARTSLESNLLGYQVGVRINIDVLNAQDQLFSARRDLAKARYDTLINSLKLKASTASLTDSDVLSLNSLLSPTDDTALTALPVVPAVPHPRTANPATGRRSLPQ
ncbi:TolC family type I secretion outer membrane protein [Caballeronia sordidicola]|uniref:TolC family type I secretion outer membrane protein n=1 Tax=Caballeronia sordidicola TaxID=196367 RepID=A0A158GZ51_CABSO|nr:TolC family outer membrane protein [Caballeronia sordidicola]SAL36869.1 TolC family type I secretion outer membrane protein [Caballeronia sordidicola]